MHAPAVPLRLAFEAQVRDVLVSADATVGDVLDEYRPRALRALPRASVVAYDEQSELEVSASLSVASLHQPRSLLIEEKVEW